MLWANQKNEYGGVGVVYYRGKVNDVAGVTLSEEDRIEIIHARLAGIASRWY